MGRRPIPTELKRDKRLTVMLTGNELEALERVWEKAGAESLSGWIRQVLMQEVEKIEEDGDLQ